MSSLSLAERQCLEKYLGMSSGYVLDFSDATFGAFVFDMIGEDIHSDRYTTEGTSKAKKLRTFWKLEPNHLVGQLILELAEYGSSRAPQSMPPDAKVLEGQVRQIAKRLLADDAGPASENPQLRKPSPKSDISEVTRRDIVDFICAKQVKWWGRLGEIEFLSRLYDLKRLPSSDVRYNTAEDDICQHRVDNNDWGDDWIFTDERFNLLRGTDELFLRFLCEMLNPVVRPQPPEVNALLKIFNKHLAVDGWELYTKHHISRRRVFAARPLATKPKPEVTPKVTATSKPREDTGSHDVFICHASEDKKAVARPLVGHLTKLGYKVWFDEFTLKLGDSLRRSIDRGLAASRYGVVILSPSFFAKNWPQYELDGLVARENAKGLKVILPVWHNVTRDQVTAYSPTLADKLAATTSAGLEVVCRAIEDVLGTPSEGNASLVPVPTSPSGSGTCARCGKTGEIFGFTGSDGDEFHWFECPHCGHFEPLE